MESVNQPVLNSLNSNYKILKKRKNHKVIEYIEEYFSFDIETSSWYEDKEKRACMYAYGLCHDEEVKIGRTWEEFKEDLKYLVSFYGLNENKRIIIWVHNLSYEFQFIRKMFNWVNVFALETREVVSATTKEG